jgi:hypothetical protein
MRRLLRRAGPPAPRPEMGESNMGRFIPRGIEPQAGRGKSARLLVLACGLLLAALLGSFAQTPDNIRTFYVPARSFNIPFSTDVNDPRIVEVLLHVSTDGKNYNYVAAVRPTDRKFLFTARQDACYSFIVQTKDQAGVLHPADLRGVSPSIRVCVDTQVPVIEELSAIPSQQGAPPGIRWKINEANLKDIRAEYRSTNGGDPVPLILPIKVEGEHPWKPSLGGELEVRMWAQDKANQWSEMKSVRLRVPDNVSGMKPPPESAAPGKVKYVKNKTFQLDYEIENIGPSEVAGVDIWKLHQGRGWEKCKEKGSSKGPVTVTVEASGRWGFRLIPRSGAGLAERDPRPGDAPDIWVEVDDKPPQVRVSNVTVTQETDDSYLTVYWKVDDTFLQPMPITILMKDPKGGEWTTIAEGLPNTGSWRHRTEDLKLGQRYEFSLKVTAVDEAGNVGEDQWREVVKVDLKVPRIKSIEVKPGGAPAGSGEQANSAPRTSVIGGQTGGSPPPPISTPPFDNYPAARQSPSPLIGSGESFNKVK